MFLILRIFAIFFFLFHYFFFFLFFFFKLILKYFCADGRDLYNGYRKAEEVVLNKEKREKYFEEEIEMYQNLCEELLKRNQNKINNEELQNYFKEIYKVKNIIEKKY